MVMSEAPVQFRLELHVNDHVVVNFGGFALPADEEFRPALGVYLRELAQLVETGGCTLHSNHDL